jgi:pimeloyl-ACP methyl ester carboxylesterase
MGAGVATLVAAAFPERIQRLVLIEGLGPLAAEQQSEPQRLARAIADESRIRAQSTRVFPSMEKAITARLSNSQLDYACAELLMRRGTQSDDDGVKLRHDPLLHAGSRFRMTEAQIRTFLAAIHCPVLAIRARDGWPFPADILRERCAAIRHLELVEVDGGHHVHLTHPERVLHAIQRFLSE